METLAKAAVTELSALLEKATTTQHRPAPPAAAPMKDEEEREVTPQEERERLNKNITNQFASLMDAWAKGAVEKILMMLKMSVCEAEDGPAASRGLSWVPRSSRQKKKKIDGGLETSLRKKKDQMSNRADAATGETNSGSHSETEAMLTEPISELASDVSGENTSTATSENKKKKTTGPFKCPACDKSFSLKCWMDRHYLTHSKPHLCSECGKCFAGLQGLIAHTRRHTGEKLYKCTDCGTEFAYKYTFDRHMRRHSLEKPSNHMCTLCENQFTGLPAFQRHQCCALKKTFVCSLCTETFDCRQSLAEHENLHSGNRDFVCEMCGESFFSSSSLATHRVTHTQKKAAATCSASDAAISASSKII
ncbi:Zinc finger protein 16 [Nibea albiflora]|uniref:Zinc finger protein 16 n=1 Tax=Nibea albiflora TaxID=240163 RepID=A0ACB7F8S9_NIBAL|nr:Zinc finger protein 16 [Nibea albiflora]